MKVVYKYQMEPGVSFMIPQGGISMLALDNRGDLCVWVEHLVDEKDTMEVRVVGTGWEYLDSGCVAASCTIGSFVWHAIVLGGSFDE